MKLSGIVKEVKLVKLGEIDAFLVGLKKSLLYSYVLNFTTHLLKKLTN